MSEYLILIYSDENAVSDAQVAPLLNRHGEFMRRNKAALRGGNRLRPTDTATSIRRGIDNEAEVTDGPFVETKEALGGYYLIEATDLDHAIAIAKEVPVGSGGVEVRPIWPQS